MEMPTSRAPPYPGTSPCEMLTNLPSRLPSRDPLTWFTRRYYRTDQTLFTARISGVANTTAHPNWRLDEMDPSISPDTPFHRVWPPQAPIRPAPQLGSIFWRDSTQRTVLW